MDDTQREMAEGGAGLLLWILVIIGPLGWGSFFLGDKNLNLDRKAAKAFLEMFASEKKVASNHLKIYDISSKAPEVKTLPTYYYKGSSKSKNLLDPKDKKSSTRQ